MAEGTGTRPTVDELRARWARLSRAEREVAALLVDGWSSKEIAERTFRSPRTVDGHVGNAIRKLGCSSRVQVAVAAYVQPDAGPAELSGERDTARPAAIEADWERIPDELRSAVRAAGRDRHWPEHQALVDEAVAWLRANHAPGHQPRPVA